MRAQLEAPTSGIVGEQLALEVTVRVADALLKPVLTLAAGSADAAASQPTLRLASAPGAAGLPQSVSTPAGFMPLVAHAPTMGRVSLSDGLKSCTHGVYFAVMCGLQPALAQPQTPWWSRWRRRAAQQGSGSGCRLSSSCAAPVRPC